MLLPSLLAATALAAPTTQATQHVLDNGLTVVIEAQHRTDEVALYLKYRVGSRDETDGERGCAHLFEHLMFEGSANVGNNMFDTWLTAAGGWNNAWTSLDETVYFEVFPSGALDLALFLESDRMAFLDAGLDADNLANQQSVVLQERSQGYAEPHGRDGDALTLAMYPEGHPYHVPVIGTVADIEGFSLQAVQAFWRKHYRPRNAVLVIVGNVDPDEALARVRHWFGDVPDTGAPIQRPTGTATPPSGGHAMLEDAIEDRSVTLAWPTPPLGHDDTYALEVLSWVLDGGRGTRLADALYYRRNLASDYGVGTYAAELGGTFEIQAASARTPLPRLVKAVDKVLADVQRRPPTQAEVDRAVGQVLAGLRNSLERPSGRAGLLLACTIQTGSPNCFDAEVARYEAVQPTDLVRVATTWLSPSLRTTLSVVPTGDDGALEGARVVEIP